MVSSEFDRTSRFVDFNSDAREDIHAIESTYPDINKVLIGIQVFLKESAHNGIHLKHNIYLYTTAKGTTIPPIDVYYTFDEIKVFVNCLEVKKGFTYNNNS